MSGLPKISAITTTSAGQNFESKSFDWPLAYEAEKFLRQRVDDELLDVREQCAIALASITSRSPELSVPRADVFAAALREVKRAPRVLELDHVFTLLSLALEREPLQIALRAVRGTDRALRGTALEYLENVLPDTVTIYQGPIEEDCDDEAEMAELVRETVIHEIGHYFGLDDDTMHRIEDGEP